MQRDIDHRADSDGAATAGRSALTRPTGHWLSPPPRPDSPEFGLAPNGRTSIFRLDLLKVSSVWPISSE
jgi:hypothetical protein